MPGRPSTRCTASNCGVPATPAVTRQSPRMVSSAHAAAPGWPSTCRYCVLCTRRVNTRHRDEHAEDHRDRDQQVGRLTTKTPMSSTTAAGTRKASSRIHGSRGSFSRSACTPGRTASADPGTSPAAPASPRRPRPCPSACPTPCPPRPSRPRRGRAPTGGGRTAAGARSATGPALGAGGVRGLAARHVPRIGAALGAPRASRPGSGGWR